MDIEVYERNLALARDVVANERKHRMVSINLAHALLYADERGREKADERDEWLGKCQQARAEIVRLGGTY
jgi:hypothetical protein